MSLYARTPKNDKRSMHALIERSLGDQPILISVDEAAAKLRIGPNTVHNLIKRGQLKCVWLGFGSRQIRRIKMTDLQAFVDQLSCQQSHD